MHILWHQKTCGVETPSHGFYSSFNIAETNLKRKKNGYLLELSTCIIYKKIPKVILKNLILRTFKCALDAAAGMDCAFTDLTLFFKRRR
jgi:hypothetical protein